MLNIRTAKSLSDEELITLVQDVAGRLAGSAEIAPLRMLLEECGLGHVEDESHALKLAVLSAIAGDIGTIGYPPRRKEEMERLAGLGHRWGISRAEILRGASVANELGDRLEKALNA
jgi:hypothetical protein